MTMFYSILFCSIILFFPQVCICLSPSTFYVSTSSVSMMSQSAKSCCLSDSNTVLIAIFVKFCSIYEGLGGTGDSSFLVCSLILVNEPLVPGTFFISFFNVSTGACDYSCQNTFSSPCIQTPGPSSRLQKAPNATRPSCPSPPKVTSPLSRPPATTATPLLSCPPPAL